MPRPRTKSTSARTARTRVVAVTAIEPAAEGQRAGVQSLGRAFGIMEEIARHRDGIGLAELSKRVGLHNSTTFHLVKTMVSLGYVRQLKDLEALPHRPPAVRSGGERARRSRDDEPGVAHPRGAVA